MPDWCQANNIYQSRTSQTKNHGYPSFVFDFLVDKSHRIGSDRIFSLRFGALDAPHTLLAPNAFGCAPAGHSSARWFSRPESPIFAPFPHAASLIFSASMRATSAGNFSRPMRFTS